jgi:hypothetical protein
MRIEEILELERQCKLDIIEQKIEQAKRDNRQAALCTQIAVLGMQTHIHFAAAFVGGVRDD